MKYTPDMVKLAEDYVRASNDCDEQIFYHIRLGNIRKDGSRVDGPDYGLLNHYSVKANHYFAELAKLLPDEADRDNLVMSTHCRLDP